MQRVADRSLAEDRMQLMPHQRQNKKREQPIYIERTRQADFQVQFLLLEQQSKKRKLMEDAKRAKGRLRS